MLHGPQQGLFDLEFRIPAGCADRLASGAADIGIVPSFELTKQDLEIIPGVGIACHGPVRSILLISSRPAAEIRSLAADASSRTSVELARIVLARKFGVRPRFFAHEPDLEAMLRQADAALIIGDPALRIDPARLPYHVYDLGAEWSCRYGRERLEAIVASESARREFAPELVREYLTRHIVHELTDRDYEGMELFLEYARAAAFQADSGA
jgi:predicted solute-binding protein